MKAIINGVEIEGTPAEILEYQRLDAEQRHDQLQNALMRMSYMPIMYVTHVSSDDGI